MIVVEGVMTTNRSKPFALEILKYAIIGINIECMDQIVKHVVYKDWDKVEFDYR